MIASMTEARGSRQPRRLAAIPRAIGLGLLGLLAACSTVVPRAAPPAKPPPPVARPQPGPPQALPEDKERHRVALLVPLTGRYAAVGRSIADAASLAVIDTKDRALRITTYDTGDGGALAVAAAQKAIAEGNRLFLGPLLAEDVRAIAGAAAAAHVPVIAFSNDASVGADNVWLLGFQPGQSIDRVVRYAKAQGLTRFAGLIPPGVYGRNAATMLIRSAEAAGGSVATVQGYDRSPGSLAKAMAALGKQKVDAVLIADAGRGAVALAPSIRKAVGPGARLLGTELWNAESGLSAAPSLAGAWYASVDNQMFDQLSTRFVARYGRKPYRLASLGYDAVLLTIRISSGWKVGDPFPVDRLGDSDGFVGVDGAFRFGDGHVAERALAVHQLGGGGTIVSAAPKGF